MQSSKIIEILKRIECLIEHENYFEAKEYINLEINNLNGKTIEECQKTKYKFNYCNICSNNNCPSKIKIKNKNKN